MDVVLVLGKHQLDMVALCFAKWLHIMFTAEQRQENEEPEITNHTKQWKRQTLKLGFLTECLSEATHFVSQHTAFKSKPTYHTSLDGFWEGFFFSSYFPKLFQQSNLLEEWAPKLLIAFSFS